MRAAKAAPLWQRQHDPAQEQPPKLLRRTGRGGLGSLVGLGALFLVGYAAGILLCREQTPEIGTAFAQYYMDKQNYLSFSQMFAGLFSALFLQSGLVFLCGMNALGLPLLAALFCAKGAVLGICAASVFITSDAKGLVVYWLLTCLPNAATLILLLWLAQKASDMAVCLFRSVLSAAPLRNQLYDKTKRLFFRYLAVLGIGAACSVLGTASAMLFAGVLL